MAKTVGKPVRIGVIIPAEEYPRFAKQAKRQQRRDANMALVLLLRGLSVIEAEDEAEDEAEARASASKGR